MWRALLPLLADFAVSKMPACCHCYGQRNPKETQKIRNETKLAEMYKNVCFRNTILITSSTPAAHWWALSQLGPFCASLSDLIYGRRCPAIGAPVHKDPQRRPATVGHLRDRSPFGNSFVVIVAIIIAVIPDKSWPPIPQTNWAIIDITVPGVWFWGSWKKTAEKNLNASISSCNWYHQYFLPTKLLYPFNPLKVT